MAQRVLIIEDDQFLGDVIDRKLRNQGYETTLIEDGAQGLKQIKEDHPDLVLLDIVLPTMSGYEILDDKQNDQEVADIPVIVISNSGQPVEINRVLALGVADYLVKADFDPDEVLEKVRRVLGGEKKAGAAKEATGAAAEGGASANGSPQQEGAKDTSMDGAGGGAAEQEAAKENNESDTDDLSEKKIMWVEDDTFLSDLIARKLTTLGCKLVHVSNGDEALSRAQEEQPDVILLDIILPGKDGFEILEEVKNDEKLANVPVILLSNLGQKDQIKKGENLGAEKFLIKATLSLDEIVAEIRKVLKKA